LSQGNDFVAYVDAIGDLDGTPCLLEWKTTSARYPEEPAGLLMLDPQLVCYSWITGIAEVAQVVFVRKRLVEDTVRRIESASSCPTAESASPRTHALPVPTSGCAWASPSSWMLHSCAVPEMTVVCLTSLITRYPPMPPRLNQKRARFVLTTIDEILGWELRNENERDTKFVELGHYLCEVRAGRYWRLESLKSFDEFLQRRFPASRRKAYYLMAIHGTSLPKLGKD
jgi:hypothetical protein